MLLIKVKKKFLQQYSYVINIKPTFNYKLSLNKYTGKEDFYIFIGKILIVSIK